MISAGELATRTEFLGSDHN